SNTTEVRPTTGRQLVWLGLALALLSPLLYVLQLLGAKILTMPWYLPVGGTLGAALMLFGLLQTRTWWRVLGVLFFGLLAGLEWYFLVSFSRLPAYAGPVKTGQSFPAFATTKADGSSFTQDDLRGDRNTVLVFFRGRW